ncbi:MAG: hypothetical protein ABS76_14380 [Pelagibacterium sp. SCN 64-44]|nr:MAG: hypothetical protein ABS76_14380 [Pelagibacterium sp. SCN 64-44]
MTKVADGIAKDINGVGSLDWPALFLIGFYKGGENIEPVAIRSANLRAPKALNFGQCLGVVFVGTNWANIHGVAS